MPGSSLDAVVFDMDGILIDSEPFWQDAEIEIFADVGLKLTREMCRRTMGLRIDQVVDHWYERHPWDEPSREVMVERVVDRVAELVGERGELLPGVHEVLAAVERRELRRALASSSYRRLVDAVLDGFSLRGRFDVVVSGDETEDGKPDPQIYLLAAERLGVAPERCLAIEDSPNGIRSAISAGMTCVAVANPHASSSELVDAGAEATVDSLLDLAKNWDRLFSRRSDQKN